MQIVAAFPRCSRQNSAIETGKQPKTPIKHMGHNFGKGEVRSSILRGSTMFYAVFMALGNLLPTSNVDTTGAKCSA